MYRYPICTLLVVFLSTCTVDPSPPETTLKADKASLTPDPEPLDSQTLDSVDKAFNVPFGKQLNNVRASTINTGTNCGSGTFKVNLVLGGLIGLARAEDHLKLYFLSPHLVHGSQMPPHFPEILIPSNHQPAGTTITSVHLPGDGRFKAFPLEGELTARGVVNGVTINSSGQFTQRCRIQGRERWAVEWIANPLKYVPSTTQPTFKDCGPEDDAVAARLTLTGGTVSTLQLEGQRSPNTRGDAHLVFRNKKTGYQTGLARFVLVELCVDQAFTLKDTSGSDLVTINTPAWIFLINFPLENRGYFPVDSEAISGPLPHFGAHRYMYDGMKDLTLPYLMTFCNKMRNAEDIQYIVTKNEACPIACYVGCGTAQ